MTAFLAHPKILPLPHLLEILAPLRERGAKVVFSNGCFDLLHPGHVDLLAGARAAGDVLVVGLNSDDSVRRQDKGPDRPFTPFAARAYVLAHLASVDFIVGFDEDTPLRLIEAIRPDVLVKGGDWKPDAVVGRQVVEESGGRILTPALLEGFSTTLLAERIRRCGGKKTGKEHGPE